MLAKKEYELIANVIRDLPNRPTKEEMARRFTERLRFDNPSFDREKFIKACSKKVNSSKEGGD